MTGTLLALAASTGWLLAAAGASLIQSCGPRPKRACANPDLRNSVRAVPGHPHGRANTPPRRPR